MKGKLLLIAAAAVATYLGVHAVELSGRPASDGIGASGAPAPELQSQELPLKLAPRPTSPAIDRDDLMTRVYIFADDSMQGRLAGSPGNQRATAYIASELRRAGAQPAGDSGGYFQRIPAPSFGRAPGNVSATSPYRNVVAIIPGSDSALSQEYIAIGAHNDHVGTIRFAVDHDSVRALAAAIATLEKRLGRRAAIDEQASVRINLDSIRRVRPARRDSINNGADDDGSGSMALLEIAEHFASMPQAQRPKRSLLLVWHSNEEVDLGGSTHLVANPPVPRNRIIAQINVDMVGRGTARDVDGGGPDYLALVGSRRLSKQLGDIIDSVNVAAQQPRRFDIDYSWDAPDHRERIYERSDHYSYAQAGIPVAFLFTGLHIDYHRVTDEPQYLDYDKLHKVTLFVGEIVKALGNRPERPRLDR